MSKLIPSDLPTTCFVRSGAMRIDGHAFYRGRATNSSLGGEINLIETNIGPKGIKTQREWQQVRNVLVHFFFTTRDQAAVAATNAFLRNLGLDDLDVQSDSPTQIFQLIEELHNKSRPDPAPSPDDWIARRQPPRRLRAPANQFTNPASDPAQGHNDSSHSPSAPDQVPDPRLSTSSAPTLPYPNINGPVNESRRSLGHHPLYNFTDHEQTYEGYQFQCPWRCLRDDKHCRKAPVREMNRHLRNRHNMTPGFKIAGVDWENKRWRGAGGGEPERIGKIVLKDAPDDGDSSDDDDNNNEEGGETMEHKDEDLVNGETTPTVNGHGGAGVALGPMTTGSAVPHVRRDVSVNGNGNVAIRGAQAPYHPTPFSMTRLSYARENGVA